MIIFAGKISMISQIQLTADGSHTIYSPQLTETYHSSFGAIQESIHVFINNNLKLIDSDTINIFEVGFGTGLNAFLALLFAAKYSKKITYTTIEKFPLPPEIYSLLNYASQLAEDSKNELFLKLHDSNWNVPVTINEHFVLNKLHADFSDFCADNNQFDCVFFDAFSPDKQPELWSKQCFDSVCNWCKPNAILTTYCAKGVVRRTMLQVGFSVERIPGPPGKREMLRAIKTI